MDKNFDCFVWSDNWCIEGNQAWFVDGEKSFLFCLNLDSKECEFKGEIPGRDSNRFRLNPRCIKCGNDIFLLPNYGDSIWVYQLGNSQFYKIKMENPDDVGISIVNFWKTQNKIIAVSTGLKQLIEINIKEKRIENSYPVCEPPDAMISRSVKVGNVIYSVSATSNKIYQFDLRTKRSEIHTIPDINGGFYTICHDGERFWLSGWRKEIYIWEKENNTMKIINDFPLQFGLYNFLCDGEDLLDCEAVIYDTPVFVDAMVVGRYIWYIPFRTNKIIYVDRDTYEVNALDIKEEEETRDSLASNYMAHKYLVQYVKENRYIGLFSFKNMCILEIDAVDQTAEKKIYSFSNDCLWKIKAGQILNERNDFDKMVYQKLFMSRQRDDGSMTLSIGSIINREMIKT